MGLALAGVAGPARIAPVTSSAWLSTNEMSPPAVNPPSLATAFAAPVKVAVPDTDPVSVSAMMVPPLAGTSPAEVASDTVPPVRLPASVSVPAVVSAKIGPPGTGVAGPACTAPETARVWPSFNASPAVVVNELSRPMALPGSFKLRLRAAPDNVPAVSFAPETWLMSLFA